MKSEATHSCLISVLLPKRLGLKLKISKFCQNKNLQNLQVFLRCGELYFQVQHLKKKEKVHIDLWYNRLSQKNTHQGEIYELPSSYHRRALLYTGILQKR